MEMEMPYGLDTIFSSLPTTISVLISGLSVLLAFWLNRRKVNIEEKTSISATAAQQVEMLMAQILMLSNELEKTRAQLSDLHAQNIDLMSEIRAANKRIGELEMTISSVDHPSGHSS